MKRSLIDLLQCPYCGGALKWSFKKTRQCEPGSFRKTVPWLGSFQDYPMEGTQEDIFEADATCLTCGTPYPVRDGIGVFLTPDLPREDLWQDTGSYISSYLREHPDVDARLTKCPLETLSPADKFFRGMVLLEQKDFAGAQRAFYEADKEIYTPEYRQGLSSQVHHVLEAISIIKSRRQVKERRVSILREPHSLSEPERSVLLKLRRSGSMVVDLASGRGGLAKSILRVFPDAEVVISDFSVRILRSDQEELTYQGIRANVDLISFDARKTPFKSGSIPMLSTLLGFQCISDIRPALREIRRVLSGYMLAVCVFNTENDSETRDALRVRRLEEMAYEDSALEVIADAGLNAEVQNRIFVPAKPTPKSLLLEGASIDTFPLKETVLQLCTLLIW